MLWCPMAISMVSAAAGLAVGSNNAIARRGMHLSFIEACIRIATTVAKLACLMASLSFSLARRARFDGLPGFRDYWPAFAAPQTRSGGQGYLFSQNTPCAYFFHVRSKKLLC